MSIVKARNEDSSACPVFWMSELSSHERTPLLSMYLDHFQSVHHPGVFAVFSEKGFVADDALSDRTRLRDPALTV